MKLVVDSSSWIDYFEGNEAGGRVRDYIESESNEIVTNILCVAEMSSFFARKGFDVEEVFRIVFSNSKIYNIDSDFSKEAGMLHAEIRKKIRDFGLVDACVLLTARKVGAKLVTGDSHFEGFGETILVNK